MAGRGCTWRQRGDHVRLHGARHRGGRGAETTSQAAAARWSLFHEVFSQQSFVLFTFYANPPATGDHGIYEAILRFSRPPRWRHHAGHAPHPHPVRLTLRSGNLGRRSPSAGFVDEPLSAPPLPRASRMLSYASVCSSSASASPNSPGPEPVGALGVRFSGTVGNNYISQNLTCRVRCSARMVCSRIERSMRSLPP